MIGHGLLVVEQSVIRWNTVTFPTPEENYNYNYKNNWNSEGAGSVLTRGGH